MTLSDKQAHSLVLLQKRYARMYKQTRIAGISTEGVHMMADGIMELIRLIVPQPEVTIARWDGNKAKNNVHVQLTYEGVMFYSLLDWAEVLEYHLRDLLSDDLKEGFDQWLKAKGGEDAKD